MTIMLTISFNLWEKYFKGSTVRVLYNLMGHNILPGAHSVESEARRQTGRQNLSLSTSSHVLTARIETYFIIYVHLGR